MADTLIIIIGQIRGFNMCQDKFKHNVLEQNNCDLAMCIGTDTNEDITKSKYYSYAKYIWKVNNPIDCENVYDEICKNEDGPIINGIPAWKELIHLGTMNLGGIRRGKSPQVGSGAYAYYYRWLLLQNIRKNNLIDKYKWFIVTRSDFLWDIPHPNTSVLNENYIYIPDGERYGGITDRHSIIPSKYIETYLNVMSVIIHNPVLLKREYYDKIGDCVNPESFIKWWLEYNNIYNYVKFFPYVMYLIREHDGISSWSTGDWNSELNCYIKYVDEYISYKKYKPLIKSQDDWLEYLT